MFRTIGALFVIVAFGASAAPARAASGWTPLGPPGGIVYALVTDPTSPRTLYAGVHGGGVLKSSDAGATWTVASTAIASTRRSPISAPVAVHVFAPSMLFHTPLLAVPA